MTEPTRRLAAILAADVVGYSRLIAEDEARTLDALRALRRELFEPLIADHRGEVVKRMGDGWLVSFGSVVDAAACAIAVQERLSGHDRIKLRIGVHLGDIVHEDEDIYGDGVNIAARLQEIAEPGGVLISGTAYESLVGRMDAAFESVGHQKLKNIARDVTAWVWAGPPPDVATTQKASTPNKLAAEQSSIMIKPFTRPEREEDARELAEGICDDLATALAKIDGLTVLSSDALDGGGAALVVEGSVRRSGARVRVNIQLVDQVSGKHLWAERFDGQIDDAFEMQDRIVERTSVALQVRLSDGDQVELWWAEAGDPKAYELFLAGRAAYKEYSRAGNVQAKRLLEDALARSPHFITAIVGLARTHIEDATYGWSADQEASEAEAKRLLDGALDLNAGHALAHMEMAHLLMIQQRFEEGRVSAEKAISIDPTLGDAYHVLAILLVCLGKGEEALRFGREALRLNPGAPEFYLIAVAEAHIALQQFGEAVPYIQRIEARRPQWLMALALSAICSVALGRPAAAKATVGRILALSPRFNVAKWRRRIFYPDRDDVPDLCALLISAGLPLE